MRYRCFGRIRNIFGELRRSDPRCLAHNYSHFFELALDDPFVLAPFGTGFASVQSTFLYTYGGEGTYTVSGEGGSVELVQDGDQLDLTMDVSLQTSGGYSVDIVDDDSVADFDPGYGGNIHLTDLPTSFKVATFCIADTALINLGCGTQFPFVEWGRDNSANPGYGGSIFHPTTNLQLEFDEQNQVPGGEPVYIIRYMGDEDSDVTHP